MLGRIPSGADIGRAIKVTNNVIGDIEARIAAVITQTAKALSDAVKDLKKRIYAEEEARIAADEAETQARIAKDSDLQAQINALEERIARLEPEEEDEDEEED